MRMLLIAAALTVAAPALADSVTSRRLGNTTYYSGKTSDGRSVTGSSRSLGNTQYSDWNVGGERSRCTTRRLGSQTRTECR